MILDNYSPCTYVLLNKGKVVYVGQSVKIQLRIKTHTTEKIKIFDDFKVFECSRSQMSENEAADIVKYNPEYNLAIPRCKKYITDGELSELYPMTRNIIMNKVKPTWSNYGKNTKQPRKAWLRSDIEKINNKIMNFMDKEIATK